MLCANAKMKGQQNTIINSLIVKEVAESWLPEQQCSLPILFLAFCLWPMTETAAQDRSDKLDIVVSRRFLAAVHLPDCQKTSDT